jgi:hypothetical protein
MLGRICISLQIPSGAPGHDRVAVVLIGWGHGDCAPRPFHTTGHAVFRIRRLNKAVVDFGLYPKL